MAACLKMVLDYHDVDVDYEEMVTTFSFYSSGLSLPQLGSYALSKGLGAEIDTLNPYLFTAKDIGKSQQTINENIRDLVMANEQYRSIKDYFVSYMNSGGVLNPHVPVKQDIMDSIDAGNPVITILAGRLLHCDDPGYNFHGNVVYGYDEKNFFVHDPGISEPLGGGSHAIDQDLLMYAITITAHADIDNGAILKIKKYGHP